MRRRFIHRVQGVLVHSRHAGRIRYLKPRHVRGRGGRRRRARG